MGSEVSQSKVAARATAFWQDAQPTLDVASISRTHALISRFLDMEYQRIPEKERIGKGAVFLCRPVAASLAAYASGQAPGKALQPTDIIAFVNAMYGIKDTGSRPFGKCMAIFFFAWKELRHHDDASSDGIRARCRDRAIHPGTPCRLHHGPHDIWQALSPRAPPHPPFWTLSPHRVMPVKMECSIFLFFKVRSGFPAGWA